MKIIKKLFVIFIITAIFSTLINTVVNADQITVTTPNFELASQGAVLMDSQSGKVLYEKNKDTTLYPASTTKILTAILAIEHFKPTDKLTASYNAVMSLPSGYSNAAIQPGETIAFQDLLDMFLIHSANEIGFIFAENISGSTEEFVKLMNKKVAELGCKNTHFTNPSGIHDKDHYTTAYDMAIIARYCMQNVTFRNTVAKTSCTVSATDKYEERYFKNTNDLLNSSSKYYYKYAIGIKTGYTSQSKRCLIASSKKDNLELIVVVLGAESALTDTRYLDAINLFDYGFENYKYENIAIKNSSFKDITVENGTKDTQNLSLILKNNITALVPANINIKNLNYSIDLNEVISAPINEGDVLGKITYTIDGLEYSEALVANHSVDLYKSNNSIFIIALVIFVLIALLKLSSNKKKKKKCKSRNNKKRVNSKKSSSKRNYKNDSIYKFN